MTIDVRRWVPLAAAAGGLALIGAGFYVLLASPRVPAVVAQPAGRQPAAPLPAAVQSLADRLQAISPYAQTYRLEPRPAQARHGTWIEVPAVGIDLPVRPGDGSDHIPQWEALVYPGTAWPATPGNSYVYAHGLWGMFGGLLLTSRGDHVDIHDYTTGVVHDFVVSRVVGRVHYNDLRWLQARSATPELTLQTCIGWDFRGDRYVVLATPA